MVTMSLYFLFLVLIIVSSCSSLAFQADGDYEFGVGYKRSALEALTPTSSVKRPDWWFWVFCPPPPSPPPPSPPPPSPPPPSPPPPSPPPPSPPPPSPPPPSPPPPSPPPPSPPPPSPPPPSPPPPPCPPPPSPPPPSPPPPSPLPPPPPKPKPRPSPFPSKNVKRDYGTIQSFRNTLIQNPKYDPKGIAKSWNNKDVCKYKGFACERVPDQKVIAVAAVDFNGFQFGGPDLIVGNFLNKLFDLAIFHANSNNFTGRVPDDLGPKVVRYLYELDLSNNKYVGEFPASVLTAQNLTFLDLRFNEFSGPIPGQVFTLDLDVLFLNNNHFTGCIPANLGSTPALYLTFANNMFTGPIPGSIGNCKKLREVLFLNNQLSGCLPYQIGLSSELQVFDAAKNILTGPIPHSFSCLKKLQVLNLAQNEFYGAVPEMVCKLMSVENLSLSYNYFTQVGPECRMLIRKKILDVRMNCILDLPGQRSAAECAAFFSQHKTCSNERSLNYIPCKTSHVHKHYSVENSADKRNTEPAPPPKIYDALKPHKLRL